MTGREIRSTGHISQRSTKLAGEAADKAGLTWGDVADMPGREACGLLFPAQGGRGTRMPSPTGSGRARGRGATG